MEDKAKKGWTIQRDGGEPLPEPIAELVERWLGLTDGDPIAALVCPFWMKPASCHAP
jgi:hypothetical protein